MDMNGMNEQAEEIKAGGIKGEDVKEPVKNTDPEALDNATFNSISNFVNGKCGITLSEKKKPLVSARIRKRMRSLRIVSPRDYYKYIMDDPTGMEIVMLIDSLSTNVTSFFREPSHLEFLKSKMQGWMQAGQSRFRLWSAACSSGEEPYSMAFVARDAALASGKTTDIRILATDISTKVLGLAHQAMYDGQKVQTVPGGYRDRFMGRIKTHKGSSYMVKQEIKDMLLIKRLNLTEMPFPMKGPMDVIFCRNVMIYFDKELRKRLVQEFYRLLKPGGYLIVGHTESLIDIHGRFRRTGPSIYVK